MSIVFILLPFALLLGLGFTAAFVWTAAQGQYDDLETPAYRLLTDADQERPLKASQPLRNSGTKA